MARLPLKPFQINGLKWWARPDLNRGPTPNAFGVALTTHLQALAHIIKQMVGPPGLEPGTKRL